MPSSDKGFHSTVKSSGKRWPETGTRTVERALTLLTAVAQDGGTLSQLARAAELSPSTASRLLATLAAQELVRRDEHGRYRAVRACASSPRPACARIRSRAGRPASPGAGRARPARRPTWPWPPTPAAPCTCARSRAPSSSRPPAGRAGRSRRRGTALGAALRGEVDAQGYVARAGAVEPEVISIAAPVYGPAGEIAAALSVLAPSLPNDAAAEWRRAVERWRVTPRRCRASLGAPEAAAA